MRTHEDKRVMSHEETFNFQLGEKEGQVTQLGVHLVPKDKHCLQEVIRSNAKLFSWLTLYMPGIGPTFHCHK